MGTTNTVSHNQARRDQGVFQSYSRIRVGRNLTPCHDDSKFQVPLVAPTFPIRLCPLL